MSGAVGPLGLSQVLWDVLACPCPAHAQLAADEEAGQLVCTDCGRRFDVTDGVPVLLIDDEIG